MNRILSLLGVTLLLTTVPACGTTKPPSPAAVRGNRIIAAVKDLSSAYEKKNLPAFSRLISDNFRDREAFLASVESVFSKHQAVSLTVQYASMFIMVEDNGVTRAAFNWDGERRASSGSIHKDGGRATLVFGPADAQLQSIEGKNPFVAPADGK